MLDRIALITGNAGKAAEYAAMLGIEVTPAKAELTEVQSLDVADVAARKAADAYAQLGEPVLVDDTGLTVHAWNGLPGALVAWFLDTVGAQGILDMAAGLTDRRATVTTALGYADADGVRYSREPSTAPSPPNRAAPPASATTPSSSPTPTPATAPTPR